MAQSVQVMDLPKSNLDRRLHFDQVEKLNRKWACYLIVAGMRIYYGLPDVKKWLNDAQDVAGEAAERWLFGNSVQSHETTVEKMTTASGWIWKETPLRIDVVGFPFAAAALFDLIVSDTIRPNLRTVIPDTKFSKDPLNIYHSHNFRDAGLIAILETGKKPKEWNAMLSYTTEESGRTLIKDNWNAYSDIITFTQKEKWAEALDSLRQAEENFLERESSGPNPDIDDFMTWECPGPKQAQQIDLRLTALIRYCFRTNPRVLDEIDSVHRWNG